MEYVVEGWVYWLAGGLVLIWGWSERELWRRPG